MGMASSLVRENSYASCYRRNERFIHFDISGLWPGLFCLTFHLCMCDLSRVFSEVED